MKRFNTDEGPRKAQCPYCHERLDRSEGVSPYNPDNRLPEPGDVSVCIECGEPAIFDLDMNMAKVSEEQRMELMQDENVAKTSYAIKAMRAVKDPARCNQYTDQLENMAKQVKEWRAKNPATNPMIQYNFQKEVGLISTFKEAIENKFVVVNADAMDMLQELGWLTEGPAMPTVNMVRAVLSHVFGE